MANRGELHLLKDSVEVEAAKTVTGLRAVKFSAEPNQVEIADTLGNTILGIALWDGVAGEMVTVVVSGFVKALSGAAVAAGVPLMVDATGRLITATSGEHVVGFSFEAASGAEEEFELHLFASGYVLEGFGDSDAEFSLHAEILDISDAASSWVVCPWACTVDKIYSVIDTTITTGDADLTFKIATVLITDGEFTIAFSGSLPGDVDSSTPSAANVVAAGGAIEILTDGGSTVACKAQITFLCTRTA